MNESNTTDGNIPIEKGASIEASSSRAAIVRDTEQKKERLQMIKRGLRYKKLEPKRINYDEEEHQKVDKVTETDSSEGGGSGQKCVISLAELSAYSLTSLESADLGSFNKAEIIQKMLSDTGNNILTTSTKKPPKVCKLCNEEYDAHQYVCLSFNTECKHMFHAKCMIRHLMKNDEKCPTCNEWYLRCK